jgi:dTMP kinase
MSTKRFFGAPLPGVDPAELKGSLIVIEGPDSSGRSTQIGLLSQWLEQSGYAVARAGLKRSTLVAPVLEKAQKGNVLSPRTMSLFYASDFYDQLENRIVPALRAGYVVLADRYIFTLMARDMVRGADEAWLRSLYSMAIVPDAVYHLVVSTGNLAERILRARGSLDYWESGMDLGLSRDWHESFVRYQRRLRAAFKRLEDAYGFEHINGNRSIPAVNRDLKSRVQAALRGRGPAGSGNDGTSETRIERKTEGERHPEGIHGEDRAEA